MVLGLEVKNKQRKKEVKVMESNGYKAIGIIFVVILVLSGLIFLWFAPTEVFYHEVREDFTWNFRPDKRDSVPEGITVWEWKQLLRAERIINRREREGNIFILVIQGRKDELYPVTIPKELLFALKETECGGTFCTIFQPERVGNNLELGPFQMMYDTVREVKTDNNLPFWYTRLSYHQSIVMAYYYMTGIEDINILGKNEGVVNDLGQLTYIDWNQLDRETFVNRMARTGTVWNYNDYQMYMVYDHWIRLLEQK